MYYMLSFRACEVDGATAAVAQLRSSSNVLYVCYAINQFHDRNIKIFGRTVSPTNNIQG